MIIRKKTKITEKNFLLKTNLLSVGNKKTFFIRTYGCQSNVRDSENISGILKELSFKQVNSIEKANLIILNTCTIRENANDKVFGEIGLLKKYKQKNKKLKIGICGCMAQEQHVIELIKTKYPQVDFVFGTNNLDQIPEILDQVINKNKRIFLVKQQPESLFNNLPSLRNSKVKAFVSIMQGCDNFCSYCIVPYVRGQMVSRSKEAILNEIKELIKKGYKEVTLLGQNVNSYGIDKKNNYFFWDLLDDVANLKIPRIRFVTSNPWNFNEKIIDIMEKHPNIMPYLHLPVQSGDDEILKRMNRKTKINEYMNLVKEIKTRIKDIAISTDIIVGFPNESNKAFENTIKMYKKLEFDNAYTFIYSPRKNTLAAKMKDDVLFKEKQKRLYELNKLVKFYAQKNNDKYLNKVVEVLVEGKSKKNSSVYTGYSKQWKVVNFEGKCKIGDLVNVKITKALNFSLFGKKIN